jgi:serine protease Do
VVFIYTEKNKLAGGKPAFEGGSGVILSPDGYILTNRHVVDDAKKVWVTLYDRSTYEACSVDTCNLMDIAVVKINASGLPAARIGDPDKLKVGDWVIALGNPLGMSPVDGIATATAGIVSKRDCSFVMQGVPYYDMIQTDAAINTGNSGGPLINLDGEVVGINSAHAMFAQNVGFAMGMNTAKHLFGDLSTLGKEDHPYIGIIAEDMKPQFTATTLSADRRVIITNVEEGTPSDAAGMRVKDIILRIDGQEVRSVTELTRILWRLNAGDIIKITCLRGGEIVELTVKTAVRSEDEPLAEL